MNLFEENVSKNMIEEDLRKWIQQSRVNVGDNMLEEVSIEGKVSI